MMVREGREAKQGFTQSVSVFKVKIMGVLCYFDGLPDDARTIVPNIVTSVPLKLMLCFISAECSSSHGFFSNILHNATAA
jgi:hypothetical protein